jgi:hypothetical protein
LIQIIPATANRYELLSNLKNEETNRSQSISENQDVALQRSNDKIKLKAPFVSQVDDHNIHKVIILGDSHVRGCLGKLTSILRNGFSLIGISKPNANVSAIVDYKYLKIEKLSKNDVIICGGARYVARNESKEGLRKISEFVRFFFK